ncbi:MAG: hypothetical protein KA993_01195, partial [Neisseria sp.]|nr:hypothetical protein [Neisseria sp.]MBP7969251.1 hypothetical protein [Neisseria sp.]
HFTGIDFFQTDVRHGRSFHARSKRPILTELVGFGQIVYNYRGWVIPIQKSKLTRRGNEVIPIQKK